MGWLNDLFGKDMPEAEHFNTRYYKCKKHGVLREGPLSTIGISFRNMPGTPGKTTFCPRCYFELLQRECCVIERASQEEAEIAIANTNML